MNYTKEQVLQTALLMMGKFLRDAPPALNFVSECTNMSQQDYINLLRADDPDGIAYVLYFVYKAEQKLKERNNGD